MIALITQEEKHGKNHGLNAQEQGVGNKMKIIVDEMPKSLEDCHFYSYRDKKCLMHDNWRNTCVCDDDANIVKPCDVFIELSEFVGDIVKGLLQKQGE